MIGCKGRIVNNRRMQSQITQDAAVRHMARSHHPDIIYHDINPTNPKLQEIDTSSTPAHKYKELISDVFKDQLQEGLNQSNAKKVWQDQQNEIMKNQYKKMCEYNAMLEKSQIQKRKDYYNAIQEMQRRREQCFVDDPRVKGTKVQDHIKANEGDHLFFKLQDQYDVYKRYSEQTYKASIFSQVNQRQALNQMKKQQKENEVNNRKRMQEFLSQLNQHEKQEQVYNKLHYKEELDKLVESKGPRRNSRPMIQPHPRHNPITNPIDHHVENPYLMRKIMEKLNRC